MTKQTLITLALAGCTLGLITACSEEQNTEQKAEAPAVKVFKIKKPSALTREEHYRLSAMTVYLEFHIPIQVTAIMLKIANFHIYHSLTIQGIP